MISSNTIKTHLGRSLQSNDHTSAPTSTLTRSSSRDGPEHLTAKRVAQGDVDELMAQLQTMTLEKNVWSEMAEWAVSADPQKRLEGIRNFRMLLSVAGEIPIQDVIETGVVPCFIMALDCEDLQLKFEAAWAITNIASGTSKQTEMIVEAGAIPKLVSLLACERDDIREQGMWGLGNVAGDRPQFRDLILKIPGCLSLFVQACRSSTRASTIRTGVWSLSNLCRGKPRPEFKLVEPVVDYLCEIVYKCEDADTLSDASWAFDGLSETSEGIAAIIASGVVPRLIHLLTHSQVLVSRPALRVVGQIATGTMEQTQVVIDFGCVSVLLKLLTDERKSVRKDACWTLSNIAAGPPIQLQELLNHNAIPALVHVFSTDRETDVRKEAAWAICNACTSHRSGQVEALLEAGCIRPVCEMLQIEDQRVLEVVLDALRNILDFGHRKIDAHPTTNQCGVRVNPCVLEVMKCDGLSKLHSLHSASSAGGCYSIWSKTGKLIEEHFEN